MSMFDKDMEDWKDMFAILSKDQGHSMWYATLVRGRNFVVGTGISLEERLEKITKIVERYRVPQKYLRMLNDLESGGRTNDNMHLYYSELLIKQRGAYDEQVEQAVVEGLRRNRENSTSHKVGRALKKRPKVKVVEVIEEKPKSEVVSGVTKVRKFNAPKRVGV